MLLGLSTSLLSSYSPGDVDDDVEVVEDIDIEGEEEDGGEKITVPPSKEPSSSPSDEIVGMQTRSRSRPIAQSQVLAAPSNVVTSAPEAKTKAKTPAVAPVHSPSPSYAIIESRPMGPAVPPLSIGLSVPHSSSVRYHTRQHSLAPSSSVDEEEEEEERGLRDDDEETVDGSEEWEYHGMAMDMELQARSSAYTLSFLHRAEAIETNNYSELTTVVATLCIVHPCLRPFVCLFVSSYHHFLVV
ncbi:hypothetical protein BS47DRAFT_347696 [Hydnum rufescens UP504]|uniref:Uncharacterized protein n=1 Tax=Hydnum rufescens UP504 TaxID=1448309 RepID=A0A9P6DMP3_9AGAM|nr:hypothetical protein BS47DRAFT_347696 [Hydnum rufescens UP504]